MLCNALSFCCATLLSVFTAQHWIQGGLVRRKLSVRPSVKRVHCDKTEIFIPYERSFSLVFWEEEWLVVTTPSTSILGQPALVGAKSLNLNWYSLVAPRSVNINRKCTTHCPISLKGAKNAKRLFLCKIALLLTEVCYKVSLCENCQQQSCKAFIGLTIHAEMIGGEHPLLHENLAAVTHPFAMRQFSIYLHPYLSCNA